MQALFCCFARRTPSQEDTGVEEIQSPLGSMVQETQQPIQTQTISHHCPSLCCHQCTHAEDAAEHITIEQMSSLEAQEAEHTDGHEQVNHIDAQPNNNEENENDEEEVIEAPSLRDLSPVFRHLDDAQLERNAYVFYYTGVN